MKVDIVLGAGFGDEGKGRTVSYLADKKNNSCVVRFNGGHQAGHTVIYNGTKHTFSSFGAATLQNIPTYWSKYCTIFPPSLLNEYQALKKLGIKPRIKFDAFAPITTPYDIYANRNCDTNLKDGSCGMGFGKTIERHELIKLFYIDLYNPKILKEKLNNIKDYYNTNVNFDMSSFLQNCIAFTNIFPKNIVDETWLNNRYENLIFEGAQGILLDKDFGFFPNVTRSSTTSLNAMKILEDSKILSENPEINVYYVTRIYQTRHGNGFMSDERELKLVNNEQEINVLNKYQGAFRKGYFDINLFNYALDCNESTLKNYRNRHNNIVVTCYDQINDKINFIKNEEEHSIDKNIQNVYDLFDSQTLMINDVYLSSGATTREIEKIN